MLSSCTLLQTATAFGVFKIPTFRESCKNILSSTNSHCTQLTCPKLPCFGFLNRDQLLSPYFWRTKRLSLCCCFNLWSPLWTTLCESWSLKQYKLNSALRSSVFFFSKIGSSIYIQRKILHILLFLETNEKQM